MKWLFKKSKWIHKYLGLLLILFLMWMSISGILLNHPELVAHISVPKWLVPPQYPIENWDRSALTQLIYSEHQPDIAYAAGKQGVWKTTDGGKNFQPFMQGFPPSRFYRKTHNLLLLEDVALLFAGNNQGLFVCNLEKEIWREIPLSDKQESVLRIFKTEASLVVFSNSHAYVSPMPPHPLDFEQVNWSRAGSEPRLSLVRLFFDLHDGKAWGLGGKLLFDAAGLILFFLSISAFYSWYYPWKRRRERQANRRSRPKLMRRMFKWFLKYHLKLGIWAAIILLVIGATGFFMRPPLLAVLTSGSIPAQYYPGFLPDNPWDQKIHNALYDAVEDRIIIEATDGLWSGPSDFSQSFRKIESEVPIFVMGATVFEPYGRGGFLVGSFNGIFHWERATGKSINILTNKEANNISSVKPANKMVTGYFKTPQGEEFITTHEQGLLPVGDATLNNRFQMPRQMHSGYRMPLWNYLFEIHNGRFFKDLIGKWYILIAPLGSLIFVLITLSGIFDWLYLKILRRKT